MGYYLPSHEWQYRFSSREAKPSDWKDYTTMNDEALLKIDETTKSTIIIREKNDNNVMKKKFSHLTDFSKNLSNGYNSL